MTRGSQGFVGQISSNVAYIVEKPSVLNKFFFQNYNILPRSSVRAESLRTGARRMDVHLDTYTNGHFLLFDCLLTVFDEWYIVSIVKNTQNYLCTNRHRSTNTVLYQRCTNRQKQSKDSQNSKNDHWCTNRHMDYQGCTNSVPIVKNSQKIVKTAKMRG